MPDRVGWTGLTGLTGYGYPVQYCLLFVYRYFCVPGTRYPGTQRYPTGPGTRVHKTQKESVPVRVTGIPTFPHIYVTRYPYTLLCTRYQVPGSDFSRRRLKQLSAMQPVHTKDPSHEPLRSSYQELLLCVPMRSMLAHTADGSILHSSTSAARDTTVEEAEPAFALG